MISNGTMRQMGNKCNLFLKVSVFVDGVEPEIKPRSHTEEDLTELVYKTRAETSSSLHSSDLEWDDTFVSADETERQQLIRISCKDEIR